MTTKYLNITEEDSNNLQYKWHYIKVDETLNKIAIFGEWGIKESLKGIIPIIKDFHCSKTDKIRNSILHLLTNKQLHLYE